MPDPALDRDGRDRILVPTFDEQPEHRNAPGRRDTERRAADAVVRRLADGPTLPSVGDTGMLTADATLKTGDGQEVPVKAGTVVTVKAIKGRDLSVKLWSGLGGKEAVVPAASFRAEPALTVKDEPGKTEEPQDYVYSEYRSILWDGAPKPADVAQGGIGDCYLIAAMGSVAAANPGAIKKLFDPGTDNQKSYAVTLHVRGDSWRLQPKKITVDTFLPTKLEDVQRLAPIYALKNREFKDQKTPLWPALLEKAYAQHVGGKDGYKEIGGGGSSGDAMEALTGVESEPDVIPSSDAAVLKQLREYQTAGKAVVCGSLGSKHAASQKGFSGSGAGPHSAVLKSDQGMPASLVKNTLKVSDAGGKGGTARDDGGGKMTGGGVKEGTVLYRSGSVSLTYRDDKAPAKSDDLTADYDWRGLLDKDLNVYAWHAYIFVSVGEDGKIVLKNPWGKEDPKPMTAADFRRLYNSINTNEVPREEG